MFDDPVGVALVALGGVLGGVLVVAFALAGIYVALSYGQWIVDRRQRGVEPAEPGLEHREALGSVFVREVVSAGALFALHPLGSIDPAAPAERLVREGRPILLLHGYMQARSTFALLGPRLSGYGLGPLYTMNLRTLEGGLEHHARLVSVRIDQIRKATGARHIDVVAHSMGGLVVRLAEAGRRESRVRRLVTLGTPHRGTQLAHLAFGAAARDMRPGSDPLRSLPPPPPGQLVSISSSHDFFVVPPENARVAPEGRDVHVRNVGHLTLLTDPEVAREVVRALGEDILLRGSRELLKAVPESEPELAPQT